MKSKITTVLASSAIVGALMMAAPALADNGHGHGKNKDHEDTRAKAALTVGMTLPKGTGQPIVGGKVTAVGSSTISITNTGGATFSVNASGAVIIKKDATSTLSSVAVGDMVLVQGAVNGSVITATTIFDQTAKAQGTTTATTTPKGDKGHHGQDGENDDNGGDNGNDHGNKGLHIGAMFGGWGNFFRGVFGF